MEIVNQSHEVENQIRKMILDMALAPGEKISERWIGEIIGVSRTPIRAALLRIEAEGLIQREGRAWQVTPINLSDIEQLFIFREILEKAALDLTVKKITPQLIAELDVLLQPKENEQQKDMLHQQGTEFHLKLASFCANDYIYKSLADTLMKLSRVRWFDTEGNHQGWLEHQKIIQSLKENNAAEAEKRLTTHILSTKERVINALNTMPRSIRARGNQLKD